MQIDRSPSRWPYVAVLVCLLALCLVAPVYWRSGGEALENETPSAEAKPPLVNIDVRWRLRPTLPGYGPEQTLDELLHSMARRAEANGERDDDLFLQLLTVPAEAAAPAPTVSGGTSRPAKVIGPRLAPPKLATRPVPPTPGDLAERRDSDEYAMPWSTPVTLLKRLELLASDRHSGDWARETIRELRVLTESGPRSDAEAAARLTRIRALASQAVDLAESAGDECLRAELLRAHWGLARRVECWSLMHEIVVASAAANRFASRGSLAGQGTPPLRLQPLSEDLEAYEQVRTPHLARAIVERQRLLAQSADARQRALADRIEEAYRNANVRLAVSDTLLDRFVEQPAPESSPVRDRIAGTPVRGRSQTTAENEVRLEPDDFRWQLELESDGVVESNTVADGGPARVRSRSSTRFTAEKRVVVDHDRVHLSPASAETDTSSQLVGVDTDFDWMPVVGPMIRDRAVEQFRSKQSRAAAEVEYKVACRVAAQLDQRMGAAVEQLQEQARTRLIVPLEAAGVNVTPIQLTTTDERLIARLRVAGPEQLAGHTPRPRAPSDSLASVQLHESALTNAAVVLELDGRRYTAPELQAHLREKFARGDQSDPDIESDTVFEFAERDAVRVRMADERLEVILTMREVLYRGDPVRNFRVHAFYRPVIRGLEAELVRDGALGIEGRLRTSGRAMMYTVFDKVLSEDRRLPLVKLPDPNDQRLAGLMITQLVLEDGWLGLAIGPTTPDRVAERCRTLR